MERRYGTKDRKVHGQTEKTNRREGEGNRCLGSPGTSLERAPDLDRTRERGREPESREQREERDGEKEREGKKVEIKARWIQSREGSEGIGSRRSSNYGLVAGGSRGQPV